MQAAELIEFFKNNPDPRYRVTLLGGVPAGWRTLTRDSHPDTAWAGVYRSFDIISPWTIGRFRDDEGIDRFYREQVRPDLAETRALGVEYLPVVFPGFSWRNMNRDAALNQIPRRAGRFFWRQIEQAIAAGNTMLYGAMFDEVDEGTAVDLEDDLPAVFRVPRTEQAKGELGGQGQGSEVRDRHREDFDRQVGVAWGDLRPAGEHVGRPERRLTLR